MDDQELYDEEAQEAWDLNPKQAMELYGLPCWCGHFGGCPECDTTFEERTGRKWPGYKDG